MPKTNKNRRGFTVVEFTVAVSVMLVLISISLSGYKGFVSDSTVKSSAYDFAETSRLVQAYSSSGFIQDTDGGLELEDTPRTLGSGEKPGTYIMRIEIRDGFAKDYYVDYLNGVCNDYGQYKNELKAIYALAGDGSVCDGGTELFKNAEEYTLNARFPLATNFCLITLIDHSTGETNANNCLYNIDRNSGLEEQLKGENFNVYYIFPQPGFLIYPYAVNIKDGAPDFEESEFFTQSPNADFDKTIIGSRLVVNSENGLEVKVDLYETGNITVK